MNKFYLQRFQKVHNLLRLMFSTPKKHFCGTYFLILANACNWILHIYVMFTICHNCYIVCMLFISDTYFMQTIQYFYDNFLPLLLQKWSFLCQRQLLSVQNFKGIHRFLCTQLKRHLNTIAIGNWCLNNNKLDEDRDFNL